MRTSIFKTPASGRVRVARLNIEGDEQSDDADKQLLLERASLHPALPAAWRDYFRKRLWAPDG